MDYKITILCKSLSTETALIRFLTSVQLHMYHKIIISQNSLVTLATLIRFLPNMYPHMVFQFTII